MTRPVHELKSWPEFFAPVWDGIKRFEWRKADRDYMVGDAITLREWHPDKGPYSGRQIRGQITYILKGGRFGMAEGYVILGLAMSDRCEGVVE